MKITVGADPEFFITHNGSYKSAIDFIGGSKQNPKYLDRPGFYAQEDNVAVEFNIPPAKTAQEFLESIQWGIKKVSENLKPHNFEIALHASAFFPKNELLDPRAQMFGCDPDYNAWTGDINPRPTSNLPALRSCGGHVHVGYEGNRELLNPKIIQAMDLFLGVPSVMLDEDTTRKQLYGKAGAWRPQLWGLEYRVLSNFWLKTPALTQWVFDQTVKAVSFAETQNMGYSTKNAIQRCINTNDWDLSHKLITDYTLEMPHV